MNKFKEDIHMKAPKLDGLKVVTAREMARIEGMAYAEGSSEEDFMENAGAAVAQATIDFLEKHGLPKRVILLVGKGNNGGDAYVAGRKLLERGIKTTAFHIYALDQCGPLCKKMHEKFRAAGGPILHIHDESHFSFGTEGVILDGLVGTGFRGQAEDVLALAIRKANQSELPILAIDIPSGVNGTTGEVGTVAIQAKETIFLGLPKLGFFLKQGWDHVGNLKYATFGLGEKYIAEAKADAFLFNEQDAHHFLPPIKRTRHKYQAGYVLSIAGSPGMPGAALLASFAALKAGAGIVRLFHPEGMEAELSGAPFELIRQGWNGRDWKLIKKEISRAKAMLMGPGIGRTPAAKKMLQQALQTIPLPMVIDADALFFLAEHPSWVLPAESILTPHHGEMELLLSSYKSKMRKAEGLDAYQAYSESKNTTVVLKGAPTWIFHPHTIPLVLTRGDPGMATAGSGDVLTGIIAGMMAQGLDARTAAALSVYLHGYSGEMAADDLTSYCLTASDLIDFLPYAFRHIIFNRVSQLSSFG
jgi:hydroxyethylthiazole kinase-like uncharacterized protein yjeF